jgi:NDP-sugar pyrophosphorylase family protein
MKALILAAGYGTRLGDLTQDTPKPMLSVAGRPLLAYTIAWLAQYGFDQIAINLHFKAEQITNYFEDGSKWGVAIHYSYEDVLLGTAGTVKNLASYFEDVDDFLVVYGDLLIDQNLSEMLTFHHSKNATVTLLLHQRPGSNSLVQMQRNNQITGFIERPTDTQRQESAYPWVNSGLQILSSTIMNYIPDKQPADFPRDVYIALIGHQPIFGFPLSGYRCAIDSPERYYQAQQAVEQNAYRLPPMLDSE